MALARVAPPVPTPRSAATQAPPLVSEHGKGGGFSVPKPVTKTVPVKAHVRTVTVKPPKPVAPKVAVDPITAQINAAQLPQLQAIKNAQAQSAQTAKTQAGNTTDYYQALAGILAGIGPATQQGYSNAANDQAAFGKGFSNGLAQVQQQGNAEQTNLAGLSGGTAPPPVTPAASDALYGVGGYIPASNLNREGAAFGAAANALPAEAAGQGANAVQAIGNQQRVDQQGFSTQLSDLAAQVPGLRQQYQATAAANALKTQTAAQHEADVRRQQQISYIVATGVGPDGKLTPKAQLELARVTGYYNGKPTAATLKAQAATANAAGRLALAKVNANTAIQRLSLEQQKAFSDLYGHDAAGNLTLAGRKAALAQYKAQQTTKKGGFTASQKQKLQDSAAKLADLYYYGKPDKTVGGVAQVGTGTPAIQDYQSALKLALSHGIPLAYAQKALNALYPMGQEGRPYIPVQQRAVLEASPFPMTDPLAKPSKAQVDYLKQHGFTYNGPTGPDLAVTSWPPPAGR